MNADPAKPGYKNIIFKPQPAKDISFASYSNETPYGQAGITWKKEKGKFIMNVNIPVGSTATVYVPASDISNVTENGNPVAKEKSFTFVR
ncbi:MAG TPA: alpha-L-rhamnosidase C-terminal domain-containing protein, partial [Bacteroidales bacterium]|nr:alpha-L-rhamnosidase C-terminal domain-containing protein [Bacteroidales bacterium]